MNMRAQQFLLELADLIERHGGADFYYTNNDDGIHIRLDGDRDDCFVGFDLTPMELRASQVREFHPAFDMPTTPAEAIAMLVEWGDPLCMTFDVKKAKRAAELLTPQARPDGDLYDTIFAAVKKGCPKCGDAHDNPERPVLNFRELEAIAGAVFAAVFPLVQARPDGGVKVPERCDHGRTMDEACDNYGCDREAHPAPAPDVARLVELLNAIDADVLAAEQIGERVTHDDIRTCVSQLRAAAQQGATNGQE